MFGAKIGARNERTDFFSRDPEGAFGTESVTRGGSFWTRIRLGKAVAAPGVRGQDARENGRKLSLFSKDPEAAFGTESATMGGSFWIRIRWGKAVAAPGVKARIREKNRRKLKTIFVL